jgi:CRISPR-associated protein Cas1
VVMVTEYPWLSVSGFGAHIKSTPKKLLIQKKDERLEYNLDAISNLMIVGGHTIHSATIIQLLKKGAFISFFEPDGTPAGIVRPFGNRSDEKLLALQQNMPKQRFAIAIALASVRSRLFTIQRFQETYSLPVLYEGELELLHKSLNELSFLIKLDEIRRLHRLTSDMYYEIMSRSIPSILGFRRRTIRPQSDPVNAMLSLGYGMLFGNCCVALVGARLDPDIGMLNEGKGSLVYDLVEPLKAEMIDATVFNIAKESLVSKDFELTPDRCMLSDDLMKTMIAAFHSSINNIKIEEQIYSYLTALTSGREFTVLY